MKKIAALLGLTLCAELAVAQDQAQAIRGLAGALVITEKCTGVASPELAKRAMKNLIDSGLPADMVRTAMVQGAMTAEAEYAGKRPPAWLCSQSIKIHNQLEN